MKYLTLHPAQSPQIPMIPITHNANVTHIVCDTMLAIVNHTECHDVACPICMNSPAQAYGIMQPNSVQVRFYPCEKCANNGWTTLKIKPWVQKLLYRIGVLKRHSAFD